MSNYVGTKGVKYYCASECTCELCARTVGGGGETGKIGDRRGIKGRTGKRGMWSSKINVSHLFAPHPQRAAMGGVKRPLKFQTREVGVIKGRKWKRYRGYYMATQRYEISLQVLK